MGAFWIHPGDSRSGAMGTGGRFTPRGAVEPLIGRSVASADRRVASRGHRERVGMGLTQVMDHRMGLFGQIREPHHAVGIRVGERGRGR